MKNLKRTRLSALLAALALLPATTLLQAATLADKPKWDREFARRDRDAREAEILVRFKPGVSAAAKEAKHANEGNRKLREFRRSGLQRVRISPAQPLEEALQVYAADPDVLSVEPNYTLRGQALPNDPGFPFQWALKNSGQNGGTSGLDIQAPLAWDRSTGSNDVVVMVLDTGIDYRHPDLAANMWVNPLEIPGNGVDDDNNGYVDDVHGIDVINGDSDPMDDNGHGTHVAGILGAVGNNAIGITGVAWRVKLIACKMLDAANGGSVDQAVECLDYAKALKARGVNIVATNNSYGEVGAAPVALGEAIAAQPDILFVSSAGNFGLNNDLNDYFPGNFALPNVLSVAATNSLDERPDFSGFGRRTVHLGAPGVGIYSTLPNNDIGLLDGTSQSTPHVTGVAALLKAQNPALDTRAIRNLILTGGDVVASLSGNTVSGRRLNAANATACSGRPMFSALKLPASFTVGAPSTVSVLSLDCGNAVGPVSGTASSGEVFSLLDDGVAPDQVAGDGEFTAAWTPGQAFAHIDFNSQAGQERVSTVDLAVTGVSGPAAAALGNEITVNVTLSNTSGSMSPPSVLNLLLSNDGFVDAGDVVLATVPVPSIGPASQVVVPVTVALAPTLAEGVKFLAAEVDPANLLAESNEFNNAASGNVMVLSRPTVDLLPTTVTAPAAGVAGSTITVSAIVANPGTTAASASLLSFYLTTGGTPTRGDLLLGTANINPLEAGDSQMAAGQVTLPASLAPGLYTIGAIADSADQLLERDEANNARAGNTINVTAPQVDLVVQGVTSPVLAKNAKPINLGATLANQGLDPAPSANVRWYLSTDATITTDDLPLGSVAAEPLAPGATTTTGLAVRIPNTVPEGNYFIGAIVDPDNGVGETDNANNAGVNLTPVTVQYLVDLVMTTVTGPTAAATGQSVTFSGRIKNRGLEAVEGEVTVGFYVSGDETIGPRDRLIATTKIDGLAAGAVKPVTATAVLRTDLPKRDFYVGAIADPGNLVPEFRNGNNELAAVNLLTVTHGPDLVVASVQAPAEVECNRSFVVDLTVTNQGTGEIGAATDQAVIAKGSNIEVGIYLSTNAGITVSDTLVGTAVFSSLAAGASLPLSVNVTLPPNLAPGQYYIGAMADRSRVLREASNANNALAGNRITVR